jgi:type II secretory pathway pseudopilin PulG
VKRQAGITMIEVVIVMGILALAMLPIYQRIVASRVTVTKARFTYIAVHLCREKLEELMSLPFDKLDSQAWTEVKGPVVTDELMKMTHRSGKGRNRSTLTGNLIGGAQGGARVGTGGGIGTSVIDSSMAVGEGDYPREYMRFNRRYKCSAAGKRMKKCEVEINWYEKGEADLKENRYMYSLSTLIANHHLAGYKD